MKASWNKPCVLLRVMRNGSLVEMIFSLAVRRESAQVERADINNMKNSLGNSQRHKMAYHTRTGIILLNLGLGRSGRYDYEVA